MAGGLAVAEGRGGTPKVGGAESGRAAFIHAPGWRLPWRYVRKWPATRTGRGAMEDIAPRPQHFSPPAPSGGWFWVENQRV